MILLSLLNPLISFAMCSTQSYQSMANYLHCNTDIFSGFLLTFACQDLPLSFIVLYSLFHESTNKNLDTI